MTTDVRELTGKELLINCARGLFLRDGYNGVSIQQIAEAAHMTKGSPYYHFKNKEDLFTQVFIREIHALIDGFNETIAQPGTLEERLHRSFAFVLSQGRAGFSRLADDFDRYIQPNLDHKHLTIDGIDPHNMPNMFMPLIEDAIASGVDIRFPSELASRFIFAITIGHLAMSHPDKEKLSETSDVEVYAAQMTEFVLHGLVCEH